MKENKASIIAYSTLSLNLRASLKTVKKQYIIVLASKTKEHPKEFIAADNFSN